MKMKSLVNIGFLKFISLVLVVGLFTACSSDTDNKQAENMDTAETEEAPVNTLTEQEEEQGFTLLFDGESAEGWRGYQNDSLPSAWEVVDGTLHIQGSGRGEAGAVEGGDILYDEVLETFT